MCGCADVCVNVRIAMRWSTVEGHLIACVLALVHSAGAGRLASEMRGWREPACLLLWWWDRESRAHALGPGGTTSTYLPHVLDDIMTHAGILPPRDFQRAAVIAAKICEHEQIPFPTEKRGKFENEANCCRCR